MASLPTLAFCLLALLLTEALLYSFCHFLIVLLITATHVAISHMLPGDTSLVNFRDWDLASFFEPPSLPHIKEWNLFSILTLSA